MNNSSISPSRNAAFQVLHPVLSQHAILDESIIALDELAQDKRDRALANEIVLGTCRHWEKIRYVLKQFAPRLGDFPAEIQRILELSAYQLLYLDRVPGYAIVSDAVELSRQCKMHGLAKAVNGILRNVIRKQETIEYPKRGKNFAEYLSITYSHPKWLIETWLKQWNKNEVESLCSFNQTQAPLTLRLRKPLDEIKPLFDEHGVAYRLDDRFSDIVEIDVQSDFPAEWFARAEWSVQDPVMTLVPRVLDVHPGQSVWDVCAAPGGKTFHIADRMQGQGKIVATDRSALRIEKMRERQSQLKIDCIQTHVYDPLRDRQPLDFGPYDAILVDAPCTGWGTFRRNPDLRWRLKPDDSKQVAGFALRLLSKAEKSLKPAGILVYSTCTLSTVENQETVMRFLERNPAIQLESAKPFLPPSFQNRIDKEGWFCGFPPTEKLDGAFIARMKKTT